jgi:hypothetical protein
MASKERPPGTTRWWHVVLGLVLLVVAAALLFYLARGAVRTFASLQKEVATAIVTGFAAVVVATVSTFFGRFLERRQANERAQQERRIPVYEDFIRGLLQLFGATVAPAQRQEMTEERIFEVLGTFTEKAVVWGSDDVLRAWVEYRYAALAHAADTDEDQEKDQDPDDEHAVLYRMEDLLLAFRSDLGLSNKKLRRGDLLRLWVNDVPE